MKIKVEIFNDGKEPVTCCREAHEEMCQFLWYRMEHVSVCALFDIGLKRRKKGKLSNGYLIPCEKCLTAREEIS